ncbi:hypothetical protein HK098_005851 [Nowakowskiella sp. JEL0407]|nr:hypothetical protein HK098_005851 [Nowakowskiella sp. JEL0407]
MSTLRFLPPPRSDGDIDTHPLPSELTTFDENGAIYRLMEDQKLRSVLAKCTVPLREMYLKNPQIIPGFSADTVNFDALAKLEALPENYTAYEKVKYKTDRKNLRTNEIERTDLYIFGHPSGKKYRSVPEFIPHLKWLASDPTLNRERCECKLCKSYNGSKFVRPSQTPKTSQKRKTDASSSTSPSKIVKTDRKLPSSPRKAVVPSDLKFFEESTDEDDFGELVVADFKNDVARTSTPPRSTSSSPKKGKLVLRNTNTSLSRPTTSSAKPTSLVTSELDTNDINIATQDAVENKTLKQPENETQIKDPLQNDVPLENKTTPETAMPKSVLTISQTRPIPPFKQSTPNSIPTSSSLISTLDSSVIPTSTSANSVFEAPISSLNSESSVMITAPSSSTSATTGSITQTPINLPTSNTIENPNVLPANKKPDVIIPKFDEPPSTSLLPPNAPIPLPMSTFRVGDMVWVCTVFDIVETQFALKMPGGFIQAVNPGLEISNLSNNFIRWPAQVIETHATPFPKKMELWSLPLIVQIVEGSVKFGTPHIYRDKHASSKNLGQMYSQMISPCHGIPFACKVRLLPISMDIEFVAPETHMEAFPQHKSPHQFVIERMIDRYSPKKKMTPNIPEPRGEILNKAVQFVIQQTKDKCLQLFLSAIGEACEKYDTVQYTVTHEPSVAKPSFIRDLVIGSESLVIGDIVLVKIPTPEKDSHLYFLIENMVFSDRIQLFGRPVQAFPVAGATESPTTFSGMPSPVVPFGGTGGFGFLLLPGQPIVDIPVDYILCRVYRTKTNINPIAEGHRGNKVYKMRVISPNAVK